MSQHDATVTATFGRQCEIELPDGRVFLASRRGKKNDVTCNDRVTVEINSQQESIIETVHKARNIFYRSDEFRQKSIASNIDQVIIVIANEPTFSDALLAKILVAGDSNDCQTIIIHNKVDLPTSSRDAKIIEYYKSLNYPVVPLSAVNHQLDELLPLLHHKTSLLVGQSGMGKSTIINQLIPNQPARTNIISAALDSGKHTTTFSRRYKIDNQSCLIDSPGLQEFGLRHISHAGLENLFREFSPLIGQCRFHNCRHINEPQCAFKELAMTDRLILRRLEILTELQQLSAK
ncbi:MAG: ribosome small subunit-dependent GTPase A [Ferrovum sp. 37-45-19]|jgi:ribosome biogenesis GTPase|uniref:ribosome small subunit-dependent GTPase A n=1 Tax=Ferrovum sp. JA12 TaxID=1356299 RepID=UPI00070318A8|nr:ribosome small subunit-dependent GTPase A [Ferrovum sp. JA12]OYV80223.1 MAG: ribosome small subunit-dependent GTPase A [Ferrovum sp. 21-44-67]OYV94500.1 MAG: ribosome small subunit-dependent GTPase A [Ferrovum sp. 37-45-19]OZB33880.1 MAG: ribosome small subunit-dependent GTPase A [Ferrovum sp. 34-44-207]HQT81601.1 ribosome small subunit-dependent GTPase A [Ferrovaceae bacterium]KRH78904.1 putative ribosome biogenesis GTPase RsgA [Ferrovum sp. JA12]